LQITLGELASSVDGTVIGDKDFVITGVSEIQDGRVGTITFLGNPLYNKYALNTKADAIFVNNKSLLNGKYGIVVSNPQLAMAVTLELFFCQKKVVPSISPIANISKSAVIGEDVTVGAGAFIGHDVIIGDRSEIGINAFIGDRASLGVDCRVYPNCSIYEKVVIGNNTKINSGTVIGCDGFGYATADNVHKKIPQIGSVSIGNDVEIGSNCTIDRATMGHTRIGDMTKIDNLVHIAHNVTIGKGCLLTAGFAIAGSSKVGDYCTFAGQVGIGPHLKIGNNSIVAAKAGVTKSLAGGKIYAGFPAREIRDYNRKQALISSIGKMRKDLDLLIRTKSES